MSEKEIADLIESKRNQIRQPFVPLIGNPESHDYADWYRSPRENSGTSVSSAQYSGDRK
jgi:hypothetical protein